MAVEPLPSGVRNRQVDLRAGPEMATLQSAAEAARMGTKEMRTRELRLICMGYAMKLAEKRDTPTEAEAIVSDAERFFKFFGGDDE